MGADLSGQAIGFMLNLDDRQFTRATSRSTRLYEQFEKAIDGATSRTMSKAADGMNSLARSIGDINDNTKGAVNAMRRMPRAAATARGKAKAGSREVALRLEAAYPRQPRTPFKRTGLRGCR